MPTLAVNKRAKFDYELIETMEAGLVLTGREVKSVRAGNISLRGSFITIHNEEAFLTNATISPWQPHNNLGEYDPTHARKILLKKSELKGLVGTRKGKGLTIVLLSVYTKGSRIKIKVALARGKRQYDKKEAKKIKDLDREVERTLRGKE